MLGLSVTAAVCFLIFLSVAAFTDHYPVEMLYLVVAASLVAIALYARDKWAAVHGRWRIRERTLHAVALGGGWPGALVAQALFNHKCSKRRFRVAFWATVLINCGMQLWCYTDRGSAQLTGLLAAVKQAMVG